MTDDELHEFDLDAWEVPAPSAGLADAVIARAREGAPAAAVDHPARPRRWLLAGGAGLLVAAAAIGTVIVLGGRHAAPANGSVVADRAQRLDLDSVSAELDSGTDVRWTRHGDTLAIEQPRGAAMWRVGDDHLEIASNGTTIDASGASLRVEVHMQLSDARLIGASALTSAAVAFVTIVVYEGHVAVHSAGQTVNVEPGATVEVRPGQPPAPPLLVGDDDVDRLQRKVDDLQNRVDQLSIGGGTTPQPAPGPLADALDRTQISDGIARVKANVMACGDKFPAQGVLKVRLKVAPDGKVTEVTVAQTPDANLASCAVAALQAATFTPTKAGGSFSYPFVFEDHHDVGVDPFASAHGSAVKCDANALEDAARQDEAVGRHGPALVKMEKAIACAPTLRRYQVAFMTACNAANVAKAKYYYPLSGPQAHMLVQMCVRNGISQDTLEAAQTAQGYLQIASKPAAQIIVDGKDMKLTTPVVGHQLPLTPGKHKVTFMLGKDKYTYPVNIIGGEVVTLSKTLE